MLTAGNVRTMVQAAAEATNYVLDSDSTPLTFYSIWNVVKDKPGQLAYPCAIWRQWTARIVKDPMDYLHRRQLVQLLIVGAAETQRTPLDRDKLVEAADAAAGEIVARLWQQDRKMIDDILITTEYDEGVELESGVMLQFTILDPEAICPPEE